MQLFLVCMDFGGVIIKPIVIFGTTLTDDIRFCLNKRSLKSKKTMTASKKKGSLKTEKTPNGCLFCL